jgi:hypothetical protein
MDENLRFIDGPATDIWYYNDFCAWVFCRIIIKILKEDDQTIIAMSLHEKREEHLLLIRQRHPMLQNVCGAMDSLNIKIRIAETPDKIGQSCFYNGWKGDHLVTSVLCFAPDGTIPAAFTMYQDALMTAWCQIGVDNKTNLNVSSTKLVSSLSLILPFVLQILMF